MVSGGERSREKTRKKRKKNSRRRRGEKIKKQRVLIPCYTESLDLVSTTAIASAAADLPRGMERTIYICDDGADPLKRMWCEDCDRKGTLGCPVRWVSGRSKTVPGNGKSLNFNYALRQIYGERAVDNNCGHGVASVGWKTVPDTEFVAGLDADMAPSPTFFTELVSRLRTPRDAFSQSAQAFWNYDPEADITDNAQLVKYEVCDSQVRAFGGVRCNGSGWVCRARAMAHAGWWRVDTTGEDQAMGIALERRGYKGYYTMKTLQVSENDIFSFFFLSSRWRCGGGKKNSLSRPLSPSSLGFF